MPGKSRKVGVWIDHRHATIVAIEDGSVDVDTVQSGIDRRARPAGGARSGTPYGPQDVIKESGLDRLIISPIRGKFDNVNKAIKISEKQLGHDLRNVHLKDQIEKEFEKYVSYVERSGSDDSTLSERDGLQLPRVDQLVDEPSGYSEGVSGFGKSVGQAW